MTPLPLTEEPNHCGDCRACCIVPAILWLDKPPHTACRHLVAAGCGIQATKPEGCRNYFCTWRILTDQGVIVEGETVAQLFDVRFVDSSTREAKSMRDFRPDRCGMLVQMVDDFFDELEATMVLEVRPGSSREPLNHEFLMMLGRATRSIVAIHGPDGTRRVMVPEFDGCEVLVAKLEAAVRKMGHDVSFKGKQNVSIDVRSYCE